MPRKIRELISDLKQSGFVETSGGKGSHRKFRQQKVPGSLILSGKTGNDAYPYQERAVRNAIRKANQ